MASESREDRSFSVALPADLHDWLDDRAAELELDREDVLVQLVASYRAAGDLDDGFDLPELLDVAPEEVLDVEGVVDGAVDGQVDERLDEVLDESVADALEDQLEGTLEERLGEALEERLHEALEDHVPDAIDEALDDRLDDRLEAEFDERVGRAITRALEEQSDEYDKLASDMADLEADFLEKIEDVRERVIQVKRETDGKAPADHEAFDRIETLEETLETFEEEVSALRETVSDLMDDDEIERLEGDLTDAREKLNRVAWVVSDLREEVAQNSGSTAVERIKRAAAQEGVERATCERCGERVTVALLTEPECPHCTVAVNDVRPEGGFLRKRARLVTASQLESGDGDSNA